ncbi:MAG TPA: hypothetical protein VMU89_22530 [Thermomicrobiaceae bacterium]|nr:hypothetical protein [Thermomicrobiaceae bacterium]
MQSVQGLQGMQIGIGRRWLIVAMVAREAETSGAARPPRVDVGAHARHERQAATLRREQDRAAARAMGWWYGLYGTGR